MKVLDRFLSYVTIPTMSDESSGTFPSSSKQLVLAAKLKDELLAMGLADAHVDEWGYVYATLPANTDRKVDRIGFISHMDTSDEASDLNIRPRLVDYQGGDIILNAEKDIILSVRDYPCLESYKGQRLIVTDGTTLLGADDKAGVAEIMTALERIVDSGMEHGKVSVAFTPDEEIGRGVDHFRVEHFGADYAYTVDGGPLGELNYENFNAASAKVTVHGRAIHPGSAKDKMVNASRVACQFDGLLPANEVPEHTQDYEGFHHLCSISGGTELAQSHYIIRDHDRMKFEAKKMLFQTVAKLLNETYGRGTVEIELTDSYYNMKEQIEPHMEIVERAKGAMRELNIKPLIVPIRGGTDGARLSYMNLPCPNLCTGGENFHSRFEFASLDAMEKTTDLLVKLVENVTKG